MEDYIIDLENVSVRFNKANMKVDNLKEYVVRLIYDNVFKKTVVAEEVFDKEPTEEQIIWCLKTHQEATFAVVANRYVIKGSDSELPFN